MAKDKDLVIVESPAKARTINKFLGKGYVVRASGGHVRDLPKKEMGVTIDEQFVPKYVTIRGKGKIISQLKKDASEANRVLLAADFDREGEAIGWHIATLIRKANPEIQRIIFNEITRGTIRRAINEARPIDENKVNAQQARRILDRLVGYRISPILWKKVRRGLSAGRVQSVAVRLVCEREDEIRKFVVEEYWSIESIFETVNKERFGASLAKIDGKKIELKSESETTGLLDELQACSYTIGSVERKETKRRPYPPFRTSTLQQDASIKLRFPPAKTMRVAQTLYEGVELGPEGSVGLISYMRTDSLRVAAEAQQEAMKFVEERYGREYRPDKPNFYKSKKGAQDAHEAVRPTSCYRTPDDVAPFLDKDQLRLYTLIWQRFLSSQMRPAVLDKTTVDIVGGRFVFRATGSIVKFPGFMVLWIEEDEETHKPVDGEESRLPELAEGQPVNLAEITPNQHFTKPPPRYSEASLVRALEEKGMGRPSTYATIVRTIQTRHYVSREKGRLSPTELGEIVNSLLIESFPEILNVEFTAEMEETLDRIEDGDADWQAVLREFYDTFDKRVAAAAEQMRDVKREIEPTDEVCDKCGKPMVIRWGRYGRFIACSGYPECKNTRDLNGTPRTQKPAKPAQPTDKKCGQCGAPMLLRDGRSGQFYGCSTYPKCRYTEPLGTGVDCPEPDCDGELVEKRARKRKKRSSFYGCNRYPKCKFTVPNKPVGKQCPTCGAPFLVEKEGADGTPVLACRTKECDYTEPVAPEPGSDDKTTVRSATPSGGG